MTPIRTPSSQTERTPLSPERLYAVAEAFTGSMSLAESLREGLDALSDLLPAEGVFSNIYLRDRGVIRFLARATRERAEMLEDTVPVSPALLALRRYRPDDCYVVDDIAEDPFSLAVAPRVIREIRSFVLLRLRLDERDLGIVSFYSRRPRAFTAEHARLLALFRNVLALQVGFALTPLLKKQNDELAATNRTLRETLEADREGPLKTLLATTPSFRPLADAVRQVAPFDATVLITGDSGTGKEVLARVLHALSPRRGKPFVAVNCAAIPAALFESELFGSEKGAFTDAKAARTGIFETAEGGTLFLDEIGELPPDIQVKLLRALQQQTIRRVGGTKELKLDVRIVAATNRNLAREVEAGRFRLDLYYRLNVFPLHLKPLRERPEDIESLSKLFLSELALKYGVPVPQLSEKALEEARAWSWPGNVRELRNVMERIVLSDERVAESLPLTHDFADDAAPFPEPERKIRDEARAEQTGRFPRRNEEEVPAVKKPLRTAAPAAAALDDPLPTFEELQKDYFREVLRRTNGKISGKNGAAEATGLHPNTLRSRLLKLGIAVR